MIRSGGDTGGCNVTRTRRPTPSNTAPRWLAIRGFRVTIARDPPHGVIMSSADGGSDTFVTAIEALGPKHRSALA